MTSTSSAHKREILEMDRTITESTTKQWWSLRGLEVTGLSQQYFTETDGNSVKFTHQILLKEHTSALDRKHRGKE